MGLRWGTGPENGNFPLLRKCPYVERRGLKRFKIALRNIKMVPNKWLLLVIKKWIGA